MRRTPHRESSVDVTRRHVFQTPGTAYQKTPAEREKGLGVPLTIVPNINIVINLRFLEQFDESCQLETF